MYLSIIRIEIIMDTRVFGNDRLKRGSVKSSFREMTFAIFYLIFSHKTIGGKKRCG